MLNMQKFNTNDYFKKKNMLGNAWWLAYVYSCSVSEGTFVIFETFSNWQRDPVSKSYIESKSM